MLRDLLLEMAARTLGLTCGLVILLAALAVLHVSDRAEMSLRTASAALIGIGGAILVGVSLSNDPVPVWLMLPLPAGVALWITHAVRVHHGQPMRRATDWAALDDQHPPAPSR